MIRRLRACPPVASLLLPLLIAAAPAAAQTAQEARSGWTPACRWSTGRSRARPSRRTGPGWRSWCGNPSWKTSGRSTCRTSGWLPLPGTAWSSTPGASTPRPTPGSPPMARRWPSPPPAPEAARSGSWRSEEGKRGSSRRRRRASTATPGAPTATGSPTPCGIRRPTRRRSAPARSGTPSWRTGTSSTPTSTSFRWRRTPPESGPSDA
jgi:hypothetical protein